MSERLNDWLPDGMLRRAVDRSSERKMAILGINHEDIPKGEVREFAVSDGPDLLRKWTMGFDIDVEALEILIDAGTQKVLLAVAQSLMSGQPADIRVKALVADMFMTGVFHEEERHRGG